MLFQKAPQKRCVENCHPKHRKKLLSKEVPNEMLPKTYHKKLLPKSPPKVASVKRAIEKARGRRVYEIDAKKPAENIFPENESNEMLPKVPKPSRKKAVVRGQHQNAQKLP